MSLIQIHLSPNEERNKSGQLVLSCFTEGTKYTRYRYVKDKITTARVMLKNIFGMINGIVIVIVTHY